MSLDTFDTDFIPGSADVLPEERTRNHDRQEHLTDPVDPETLARAQNARENSLPAWLYRDFKVVTKNGRHFAYGKLEDAQYFAELGARAASEAQRRQELVPIIAELKEKMSDVIFGVDGLDEFTRLGIARALLNQAVYQVINNLYFKAVYTQQVEDFRARGDDTQRAQERLDATKAQLRVSAAYAAAISDLVPGVDPSGKTAPDWIGTAQRSLDSQAKKRLEAELVKLNARPEAQARRQRANDAFDGGSVLGL